MDHGIHFISGLPRSGSTLLSAILRQNPRFHAMMTSPVGAIFLGMLEATSRKNEAAVFISPEQKRALLEGVFSSYYRDIGVSKVVFDTNRIWCSKMPALSGLFPEAKVICCVRHVPWIMDSIERLGRRNAYDLSGIFGFESGGTVYTRINRLALSDGMVGYALDALREAFYGGWGDRMIVVTYEALTRDPAGTIAMLYDFIGEPAFKHDFDDVEYSADEFDAALGAPGLHTVRRKAEFVERATILPPELFQRFENDAFWMNPDLNPHGVRVIRYVG
ncbi:MAG TPA: sulfotransferase [Caulobacteraceae bacterium]|jgi:sulfotransferase|nr:sulfotransferase [Caulobacteraceae bacterium]